MERINLGEFEELVMLTVGCLYPQAYGVSIKKEIKKNTNRELTLGSVHAALNRLEEKGYLKSYYGEATAVRGGKRKRIFLFTAYGSKALGAVRQQRELLWDLIPEVALKGT